MIDTTASATPMPPQPVATETNPEALPLPPDPLPNAVAPSVTDPVPNLDFLPADDAFALEMRSETIEQLVGGDALRRGVSERIEAGRSQTNADLVAGHDRVRVQGTLHEHTGHGLAEQSAHLHTTVDGTLDVHAGCEDTVLLAGHMRDLWDGDTAIVAAMTDDTAAGGGIRVTTPLDLWVHGLMGVEERIGTCTADAVLMELGATHYEREYGPGVHAAGLAVYTGSLYQSSRSSFRPLMRVSSGVRNLIAGGDGGGAGGDAGAGSAPGASPPPVPAQTGAAEESAAGTLAAGRRVVEAPATALDSTDALTDPRRVPLEELVNAVDARAAEGMGEAGIVMRAEDLPELTRCTDTAEQLGALREALRIDKTAGSEVAGGSRASEFAGAVWMHPASGGGGPLEIDPSSAVHGENARIVRPHPDVPWGQGQEIKPGLPGGADRPPQPAAPESDFRPVYSRLRELTRRYHKPSQVRISREFKAAVERVTRAAVCQFTNFGGNTEELAQRPPGVTNADQAVLALQKLARQASMEGDSVRAGKIRAALDGVNEYAVETLQALCTKYDIADAPPTRAMQQPPATSGPNVTVTAIPPPAHTPIQSDWASTYRQVRALGRRFRAIRSDRAHLDFHAAADCMARAVLYRFKKFGGNPKHLASRSKSGTKAEQAYRAIEDMARRAAESDNAAQAEVFRQALEDVNKILSEKLSGLTTKYGALDALSTQAMQDMPTTQAVQLPPARVGPATSVALPVTVLPSVTGGAARVPFGSLDPGSVGHLTQVPGVPGLPPASGLPGPRLCAAAGAEAGDLGRRWLDPPGTASGATAAEQAAIETPVAPSLGGTSSFWLQPFEPVPAPGPVRFDIGVHHAGETVQPPPVTTTASSTAPALSPGAAFPTQSWRDDNFDVERALLANELPREFNSSLLVAKANMFKELGIADFGIAGDLAAGRLPLQTIDVLIDGYRATDEGGSSTLVIEYLSSLKETIERALRDAYPERTDPQWLNLVRELLRESDEPAPPSAASTAGQAEFDVMKEIDRLLETSESVSHPAPLPPPSTPGFTGAGAEAPPPAADPWRIRPQGMGGEPHPVPFAPWSAPSGRSSQVVYTQAIRTPIMSTGAPPRWQSAGTPGFARAASDAVELPFSRREAIALRFSTEDALREAEHALRTVDDAAFGWSATRRPEVLANLLRLNAIVRSVSAAAAARIDIDWRAIETLVRILDVPPLSR